MQLTTKHDISIVTNMDDVKNSIMERVKQYDIVVTEETVKDSKQVMADINKEKADFSNTCKAFLKEVSAPIDAFKASQKEIESIYTVARSKIESQVKQFEQKKLDAAKFEIEAYISEVCEQKGIAPYLIQYNDLILLGSITAKGLLTSKTKETIDFRVVTVENEIMRQRAEAEQKEREAKEAAEKAKHEAEIAAAKREGELKAQINKLETEKAEMQQAQTVAPTVEANAEPGKKIVHVRIDIAVEVPEAVSEDAVLNRMRSVLPETLTKFNHNISVIKG